MFNGFSWQTRILEVRLDRMPPDFENGSQAITGTGGYLTATAGSPTSIGYGAVQMPGISHLPVPGQLSQEYNSHFVLERPKSTSNSGRNLFVGNVSHPSPKSAISTVTSILASLPLSMARLKRSLPAGWIDHQSRRRFGLGWTLSGFRHSGIGH
jgi:hypothetical protein